MCHSVILHPNGDVYASKFGHEAGLSPTFDSGSRTLRLSVLAKDVDPYDSCLYKDLLVVQKLLPQYI